jgi:hypothetical protein
VLRPGLRETFEVRAQDLGGHRGLRRRPDAFGLALLQQLAVGLDRHLPEPDDRVGDEVGRAPLQQDVLLAPSAGRG